MSSLGLFFLVSLASTAAPGPAVFYVTSQSIFGGMRSGVPAALGILAADAFYIVLSVTGLSAVLAASYELFTIMKWAGAAYLVYLGFRLLRSAASRAAVVRNGPVVASRKSFISGFAIHAANPKALLFFGSLVPQFVDPKSGVWPQVGSLAVIHLCTAAAVLLTYAAISARFRHVAVNPRADRAFRATAGISLLGAGAMMAFLRKSSS